MAATLTASFPGIAVAKGKGSQKPTSTDGKKTRVFAVRLPDPTAERVEAVAEGLGLDEASFLRMLITENLAGYERRIERIKAGDSPTE
jgi:predicted DNA-binding protein